MEDTIELACDVLVAGAGAAGMFAALTAARDGAKVILLDKNVVGRGGASIMAQMTCAAALGEAEPAGSRASLRLDVSRPDHLAPLLGVLDNELAELGRRVCI